MDAPKRRGPHRFHVVGLEYAEHLQHRRSAGGWQRHSADAVRAIGAAYRLAHLDPVIGEIGERHVAGIVCDRQSPSPRCRGRSPLRRTPWRRRPRSCAALLAYAGFLIEPPDRKRIAEEIVEVGARPRLLDVLLGRDHHVQARRHLKSVLGEVDRGLEELCPGQLAVPLVSFGEQRDRSRHADRLSADHRRVEMRAACRRCRETGRASPPPARSRGRRTR